MKRLSKKQKATLCKLAAQHIMNAASLPKLDKEIIKVIRKYIIKR